MRARNVATSWHTWINKLLAIVGDDLDFEFVRAKWQAGWSVTRTVDWLMS